MLVQNHILTKEEAREILFNLEEVNERSIDSLKEEIKFLRELVQKLSTSRTKVVEIIENLREPYYPRPWYAPYSYWCDAVSGGGTFTTMGGADTATCTGMNTAYSANSNFSDISTF